MLLRLRVIRSFSKKPAEIIQNEFENNPYFENNFPKYKAKLQKEQQLRQSEYSWANSLFYKYKPDDLTDTDKFEKQQQYFVDGYHSPRGPLKWMTKEDKELIHRAIDHQMEQLERTGMTRDEILYNRGTGLPLSEDPVYQYLKINRSAREMLVKPGEEFSVEKVIDLALRQDFGYDRSKTLPDFKPFTAEKEPQDYYTRAMLGKLPNKIEPMHYYWKAELDKKLDRIQRFDQAQGYLYPAPVMPRDKFRKRYQRVVNMKDIHYKNTEFLSQFMRGGRIKNRWQTRLTDVAQRKVAKAIKHARNLNLFPFQSYVTEPMKENLMPMYAQTHSRLVVHAGTGTVYAKTEEDEVQLDTLGEYPKHVFELAKKFQPVNPEESLIENDERKKLLNVDHFLFPNKEQLKIFEARERLKTQGADEEYNSKFEHIPSEAVQEVFLAEESASSEFLSAKYERPKEAKVSIDDLWKKIEVLKHEFGVESIKKAPWVEELQQPKPYIPPELQNNTKNG